MSGQTIRIATIVSLASVLWLTGLRLFLRSPFSNARRLGWSAILAVVGLAIGVLLPLNQLWEKFLVLMVVLPVLGAADLWIMGARRGLLFWVRACGFEVCSVFGVAAGARLLLDMAGVAPLIPMSR